MTARRGSAGGAAQSAGAQYQARYAAFLIVKVLSNRAAEPPWQLGTAVRLTAVSLEQDFDVDDVVVETSTEGVAFIQVKRRVEFAQAVSSEFGKAMSQFVRLYLKSRPVLAERGRDSRPLDLRRDRLVLAVGAASSATLTEDLHQWLNRLRQSSRAQTLMEICRSAKEQKMIQKLRALLETIWADEHSIAPQDSDLLSFLRFVHIHKCEIEPGEAREENTLQLIRYIIQDSNNARSVWDSLISWCLNTAVLQAGITRSDIQQFLSDRAIALANMPDDYEGDILRLQEMGRAAAMRRQNSAFITLAGRPLRLREGTTTALYRRACEGSLMVVGQPGVGKTGALHDLWAYATLNGHDVVFVSVEEVLVNNLLDLKASLGMQNELSDVLAGWRGSKTGFLVIDGLDAARAADNRSTLFDLINAIVKSDTRWNVVASMRSFDLQHHVASGGPLRNTFEANNPQEGDFAEAAFQSIRHFNIPPLTETDLNLAASQSPALTPVLSVPATRELARIPFNLYLISSLLDDGVISSEIDTFRTQTDLLKKYWQFRVELPAPFGREREELLGRIVSAMVTTRRLSIAATELDNVEQAQPRLLELVSSGVLREAIIGPVVPNRLSFSHNVVFDYAASRLALGTDTSAEQLLTTDPVSVALMAPSITMHARELWGRDTDREGYWAFGLRVVQNAGIPTVAKILVLNVAVRESTNANDFAPLIRALVNGHDMSSPSNAISHMVSSLLVGDVPPDKLGGDHWASLAFALSSTLNDQTAWTLNRLLFKLHERVRAFIPEARSKFGVAARALLAYAFGPPRRSQRLVANSIDLVSQSISTDVDASIELLTAVVDVANLAENGYNDAPRLTYSLAPIISATPDFAATIYTRIFSVDERSETTTQMAPSQIFGFSSNRRQDYNHAKWQLDQKYADFMDAAPIQATVALIAPVERYVSQHSAPSVPAVADDVVFDDVAYHYVTDHSSMWFSSVVSQHDPAMNMLRTWLKKTANLFGTSRTTFEAVLSLYLRHVHSALFWRVLLLMAIDKPESIGVRLAQLLTQRPILSGYDTTDVAGEAIRAVYPFISVETREKIEHAILGK